MAHGSAGTLDCTVVREPSGRFRGRNRRPVWRSPVLGPVLLAASRSDQHAPRRRGRPRHPAGGRTASSPGDGRPVRCRRSARSPPRGLEVTLDHLGEDVTDPAQAAAATGTPTCGCSRRWPLEGLGAPGRGVGQAVRVRPGAAAGGHDIALENVRRSSRPPPRSAPRSPSTWRTTPRSTRRWRSSPNCARTTPRTGAVAPVLPVPHRGRLPRAGRPRAPGSGWSRAPTRSPPRSPTRTRPRSTRPTCAACGS